MINYKECGHRLHRAIRAAGYKLANRDGVWISSNDVAVQAIIDAYDTLSEAKAEAKQRIKLHAATLVHAIYPFVDAEKADVIGFYNYTIDMWGGGSLPSRLQELKAVRDTAVVKIAEVNALTGWQAVDAYDATIGW